MSAFAAPVELHDSGLMDLAERAARLPFDDIPVSMRRYAAMIFADTIGVIAGGARTDEVRAFVAGDGGLFGALAPGGSQILTPLPQATDALTAAFANGIAGTFLELDEGVRPTGHPAVHVIPAALAAAQALHASGRELLAAIISGYEVAARLFRAYRLRYPAHPHGHLGGIGAAVAVARLLGAAAGEPAAIAATLPVLAVWAPCFEGTTVRSAFAGHANALGVRANQLAAAGFTGSPDAPSSAFAELVGELADPTAITDPVDPAAPAIAGNYIKLYSACGLAHPAIDAVLGIGPLPPAEEIERIEVTTGTLGLRLARMPTGTPLSTRFSIPYAVATAAIHGDAGAEAFEPMGHVVALARRVDVRAEPEFDDRWPGEAPARVVVYAGGRTWVGESDNPAGHLTRRPTPETMAAKFAALVGADGGTSTYDYERLCAIEDAPDCAAIF